MRSGWYRCIYGDHLSTRRFGDCKSTSSNSEADTKTLPFGSKGPTTEGMPQIMIAVPDTETLGIPCVG